MSVVTVAQYRTITEDVDTSAVDVQASLSSAQGLLEDFLKRPLESATRTEVCRIHARGRVFPLATPVLSISSPTGTTIHEATWVTGAPIDDVTISFLIERSYYEAPYSTIVYIGGYTSTTLPETLRRSLVDLARVDLRSPAFAGQVPVGVSSVSMGDASLSFAAPSGSGASVIESMIPGIERRVRQWRYRF